MTLSLAVTSKFFLDFLYCNMFLRSNLNKNIFISFYHCLHIAMISLPMVITIIFHYFPGFPWPMQTCKILNTSSVFVKGHKYEVGLGDTGADFMGLPFLFWQDFIKIRRYVNLICYNNCNIFLLCCILVLLVKYCCCYKSLTFLFWTKPQEYRISTLP